MAMLQQTDEYDGMVREIFADSGQIRAHFDAELAQMRRRPYSRAHQKRRRMQAAEREDDLSRAQCFLLSAETDADAGGAPALEYQAGRDGAVDDHQIAARAHCGVEVADRGGRALVRPVAHGHGAVAIAKIRIHIRDERDLPFLREGMYRLRQRRPVFRLGAADRHRAIAAVSSPEKSSSLSSLR